MRKVPRSLVLFMLAVAAVLLVSGFSVIHAHAIAQQMHRWKLLPEPERLTELYFTKHRDLPVTYVPGTPQAVSFTVHNVEHQAMSYAYVIVQRGDNGQAAQLGQGSLQLADGATKAASVTVTPVDLGRSQIIIQLLPTNESINYWVGKEV